MNKKGFTLVELLAVIIIISLLALLTSTSITKMLKDAKGDLSNIQIASIKASAESWGVDNLDKLPGDGECKYLTLKNLKDYGILDSNIIDPKNNESISNELKIKISSTTNSFGNLITDYEVNPESIEGCSKALYICEYVKDIPADGDLRGTVEYKCEVDPNHAPYTFYKLSENKNTKNEVISYNLILNEDFCADGLVESESKDCKDTSWISFGDYNSFKSYDCSNDIQNFGPITALKYLAIQTKSWTNIKPLNYFHENLTHKALENISDMSRGYTSLNIKDGKPKIIENYGSEIEVNTEYLLRARLPQVDEIKSIENYRDSSPHIIPNWLLDTNTADGYWLLDTVYNNYTVWEVYDDKLYDSDYNLDMGKNRPVIEIPLEYIK